MIAYTYEKSDISPVILKESIQAEFVFGFLNIEWNRDAGYIKINFDKELTTEQKTELDSVINNHVGGNGEFFEENYLVKLYSNNKLVKDIWYEIDNGDGTYSGKAREIEYVWDGNKLSVEYNKLYCTNDVLWSVQEYAYYTGDNNSLIKKKIK